MFTVLNGTDIEGNNLGKGHDKVPSVAACCDLCTATGSMCGGFSFRTDQHKCYLKIQPSAGSPPTTKPNKVTCDPDLNPNPHYICLGKVWDPDLDPGPF